MNSARALLTLLILGQASLASAQPIITVKARLSETEIGVGDVVSLYVDAEARVNGDIQVEVPTLKGLSVVGRRESTQMSMSFSGAGQVVRRVKQVVFEISAEAPGHRTIPPITASIGSERARSAPLRIKVRGDAAAPPTAATDGEILPPGDGEQDLFIRYRVSRGEAWLGQAILLDLELFANPRVTFQVESIPDPPDLDGFWKETLERPKRLHPRDEQIGGRRFQVFRAWRLALFPLSAGAKTIEPIAVTFRLGGSGIFGGGRRARRRTRAIALDVKPLPTQGRPPRFENANVGTYALNAEVSPRVVEAGKAVVLTLSLSGVGNIKSARLPELGSADGFRVFPPTLEEELDLRPTGVRGTKRAEILLVPQRGGQLTVPGVELPIFDPRAERYVVLRTEPTSVEVRGEPPAPAATPLPPEDEETPVAAGPRAPLRYRAELTPPPTQPWTTASWWGLLLAGPFLWSIGAGARRWTAGRDDEARKAADARKEAASQARQRLHDAGDAQAAASAFEEALHARALEVLGRGTRGSTADEVSEILVGAGASSDLADRIRKALDAANYARFAPDALPGGLEGTREEWLKLVDAVDAKGASS